MLFVSPKQLVPAAEERKLVSVKVAVVEAMESGVDSEEDALEQVPRDVVPPAAGGEDILSEDEAAGEMVCTKEVEVVSTGVCPLHGWFVVWIEVGASPSCCK